jgi:class 3 adenylate cyclase
MFADMVGSSALSTRLDPEEQSEVIASFQSCCSTEIKRLVGSSALSTRLDPEEQSEVIASFQSCCSTEIKRLGGTVAQYLGDGMLAYFGYPAAHEDDAERAIRAGLAIIESISKPQSNVSSTLQARIGIASGVVVVGDLVREGVTQENAAIGETTNLAARLQSLAEPNTILIAPETHRLVGPLFEHRDLGQQTLKGFDEPLYVWQVIRPSQIENRFEVRRAARGTRLLGRDEELDLLWRRWEQAKRGEGRVVLVTGEPGIGKSRLPPRVACLAHTTCCPRAMSGHAAAPSTSPMNCRRFIRNPHLRWREQTIR